MAKENSFTGEGGGSAGGRVKTTANGTVESRSVHGEVMGDAVVASEEVESWNQAVTVEKREKGSTSGEVVMRDLRSGWQEGGHMMKSVLHLGSL
jgi:hypothetical protein